MEEFFICTMVGCNLKGEPWPKGQVLLCPTHRERVEQMREHEDVQITKRLNALPSVRIVPRY